MIDEEVCRSPLTEAEIGALADGAIDALSPAALEHAETCSSCAARIADEAMLALQVGSALMALATGPTAGPEHAKAEPAAVPSARPAVPSPTKPILIALAVAAVSSLPLVPSLGRTSMLLITSGDLYRSAAWQGVTALASSLNGPVVTFTVAAGLVALSAIVARFSHRLTSEGAVK
jgi:hypothetical protein